MIEPFRHPRALHNRALKHLDELKYQVDRHFKTNSYVLVREKDRDDPSWTVTKVRFTKDLDVRIPCITFDVVNCLRSSLDYAVFDASSLVSGKKNPRETKFPFGETKKNVEEQFLSQAKHVPHSLRQTLVNFQPYKAGTGKNLWTLNKIRNGKIHRRLAPFAVLMLGIDIGGSGDTGSIEVLNRRIPGGNTLELYRSKDTSPTITIEHNLSFGLQHEDLLSGEGMEFLREVATEIDDVLRAIKAEALRLAG